MSDERASEERLARAVISQALTDAGIHADRRERISVPRAVEDAARSFLTANAGMWKAARCYWADLADVDPEKLRTRTMELLGIEPPPIEEPKPTSNEPLRLFHLVPKPPKPSRPTKRKEVFDLLSRSEGVSLDEVQALHRWTRARARECLNYEMKSFGVQATLCRDGRYRAFKRADDGRLIVEAA